MAEEKYRRITNFFVNLRGRSADWRIPSATAQSRGFNSQNERTAHEDPDTALRREMSWPARGRSKPTRGPKTLAFLAAWSMTNPSPPLRAGTLRAHHGRPREHQRNR